MNFYAQLQRLTPLLLISFAGAQAAAEPGFDRIVVFGDSISDTGNVLELSQGAFAGEPYFGGRFSNGPVWVEHLAHALGLEQPTEDMPVPAPSLRGGTNYAFGGAKAGPGLNQTTGAFIDGTRKAVPNIGLQVETYLADVAEGRHSLDDNTLFVVQGGSNNTAGTPAAVHIAEHVSTLAGAGAKLFLVPNLYRLSDDPWAVNGDPAVDNLVSQFNETLTLELKAVGQQYDGVKIMEMNWFELYDKLTFDEQLQDALGLTNVTDPVCPDCASVTNPDAALSIGDNNPDEFLYWDAFHFTRVGNEYFGEAAAEVVQQGLSNLTLAATARMSLAGEQVIPAPPPSIVGVGEGTPGFPTFGDGLAVGTDTAVPEPSSVALLALGLLLLGTRTSRTLYPSCEAAPPE